MGLNELLKKHGFFAHPFITWIAENEKELEEWFIPPPFLDALKGETGVKKEPLMLVSNIIFGKPGSGKTAIRIKLEHELLRQESHSLVLRYVNFIDLLSHTKRPTLGHHVDEILRLGTVALLGFWYESRERYEKLKISERGELAGLVYKYYETLPKSIQLTYVKDLSPVIARITGLTRLGRKVALELYNTTVSVLKKDRIEPTTWETKDEKSKKLQSPVVKLERFWSLASAMGARSIWILVDGVDETTDVSSGKEIFEVLADLLLSLPVMEFRQDNDQVICFKTFLTRPDEVRPLLDEAKFRKDRIKIEEIKWLRKDLNRALKKRLAYFSNNSVLDFDMICVPEAIGTHDLLLDEAGLCPRTLFRIAHEIFIEFQRRSDPKDFLLDKRSIEVGIQAGKRAVFPNL